MNKEKCSTYVVLLVYLLIVVFEKDVRREFVNKVSQQFGRPIHS
jgi:hypothetical protein